MRANGVVFAASDRPDQGVHFPSAEAYIEIEAANLMRFHAASLFDGRQALRRGGEHGQLLAAKASWEAANVCLQTHGGFGFACEFDVERKSVRRCTRLRSECVRR